MRSIVIASTVAIAVLTGGGAYAANALDATAGADMCSSSVQDAVAYSVEVSRC